eukprot:630404-Rhodomonas_salina.1
MSCTDLAYGATRGIGSASDPGRLLRYDPTLYHCAISLGCAVLGQRMVLRMCYAMSGTELVYGATHSLCDE